MYERNCRELQTPDEGRRPSQQSEWGQLRSAVATCNEEEGNKLRRQSRAPWRGDSRRGVRDQVWLCWRRGSVCVAEAV